jgi:glutamate-1-semialdehyde 2,1-aminomutase
MPETSAELLARAARVIPGGVNSGRRRTDPPLAFRSALGAYLEEVTGERLIDYYGDAGAAILGHGDPYVADCAAMAMRSGMHAGVGVSKLELELAEQLTKYVPSAEQVLFCNSGSEATAYALRLARAFTGRPFIVRMEGSYHGWHDAVIPFAPGVLASTTDATFTSQYNNLPALEHLLNTYHGQIAAVIVEPIVHNGGPTILPDEGFLLGLRRACDQHGTVLIFDEVVTGIRHHLGGVQALSGVRPHLTTMGKALANGFPIGVLAGPTQMMSLFNTTHGGVVPFAGTFNGNGAAMAAGLAVISRLRDGKVHKRISRLGKVMREGLQEIADSAGVEAHATGWGSVFTLWFGPRPRSHEDVLNGNHALFTRYRQELRARGSFEKADADGGRSVISASHTEDEIAASLEAAGAALRAALNQSV